MEPKENEAVAAFDTLYTNNHIQILKILLPHFDSKGRKRLAILIKFMELRYTMEYFSRHTAEDERDGTKQPDIVRIFEQIKNFCTPSERAMFDQLANLKKSMEMYEEMTNMMQLFSQLMPEGEDASFEKQTVPEHDNPDHPCQEPSPDGGSASSGQSFPPFGDANPMNMLKGMLSPEQQAMFEMFQSSLGNTN